MYEPAMACYDEALRIDPEYAEAHMDKGVLLAKTGRIDEALECCMTALWCIAMAIRACILAKHHTEEKEMIMKEIQRMQLRVKDTVFDIAREAGKEDVLNERLQESGLLADLDKIQAMLTQS